MAILGNYVPSLPGMTIGRLSLGLSRHWPGVWGISSATPTSRDLWPSCVKPSSLASPLRRGHAAGSPPDPWGLSPSPDPRPRQAQPRPPRGSARRVPRTSQRLPCRRRLLPLVLPPFGGKTTQPLVPEGFPHPEGGRGGAPRRGQEEAGALRQPGGSRRCPPRVRLCPAAAPAPAPAPQGGSSNSPARDGEGETCCFLSAAHVPQLAKRRLVKFHTKRSRLTFRPEASASAAHARSPRAAGGRQRWGDRATRRAGAPLSGRSRERPPEGQALPPPPGRPAAARSRGAPRYAEPSPFPATRRSASPGASWGAGTHRREGWVDCCPQRSTPAGRPTPVTAVGRGVAGRQRAGRRGWWSGLRRWVGQRRQGRRSQGALGAPKSRCASGARRARGAGAGAPAVAWRPPCPQNR